MLIFAFISFKSADSTAGKKNLAMYYGKHGPIAEDVKQWFLPNLNAVAKLEF